MTAPVPGLTLNFDGGTDGASLATGGGITAVSAPAPTYSAAAAIHGALGITGAGTSAGPTATVPKPAGFTDANGALTVSQYFRPTTAAGGAIQIANFQTAANATIGLLRFNVGTGKIDMAVGGSPVGASTLTWVTNTTYRVDVSYAGPTSKVFTVKVFADNNSEGTTPDDTFTGTATSPNALDHILFSPSRSSVAGCAGNLDTIRLYDGVVTPAPFAPLSAGTGTLGLSGTGTLSLSGRSTSTAGTVNHAWLGAPTRTGFRVVARTTAATTVRLAVSTSSSMTSPSLFGPATPDSAGYVSFDVTGLAAGTRYYYQLQDTPAGGAATAIGTVGRAKTLPAGNSHTVALGSCITTGASDASAMNSVVAYDPDVFLFVGDFDYSGDTSTLASHQRATYENQINTAAGMQGLLRDVPWVYCTSDHEAGPDNGDSNNAYTAANITAYKQIVPAFPLADTRSTTGGRYQSFVIGRVRYILLDIRNTDRSPGLNADDATKTMLGSVQKSWLKARLLDPEPVKVIVSDVAWMGAATTSNGEDKWWSYATERQEIANFIAANGVRVLLMHGDSHALGTTPGANNAYGGFPVYCASPMHNTGGGRNLATFTQMWNNSGGAVRAYGRISVTDTGSAITFTFSGWDASAGVERITQTDTFTVPAANGLLTLSGSSTLALSGRPAIAGGVLARTATGALTLRGAGFVGIGRYVFRTPVVQRRVPVCPPVMALMNFSTAVLRIGGQWIETEYPSEEQIAAADLYFPGGYENVVDPVTANVLQQAGYTIDVELSDQ